MKICDFNEFCGLPDGTIFSYWEPAIASGLYQRGEVIVGGGGFPIDFWEASLIAESLDGDHPVVSLDLGRCGIHDWEQLFAVYEDKDVEEIQSALDMTKPRTVLLLEYLGALINEYEVSCSINGSKETGISTHDVRRIARNDLDSALDEADKAFAQNGSE